MPARARRIAVLAHCHLNVNTKVHGLAYYPGTRADLLSDLSSACVGIVQLPCPEITFLGMNRWGMTREQYDTPAYRRHCASLLQPVVDTIVALAEDGCEVVGVYGVDGSPSCGVDRTCIGYTGGEIEATASDGTLPEAVDTPGPGVFFEALRVRLEASGIRPPFIGIDERAAPEAGAS